MNGIGLSGSLEKKDYNELQTQTLQVDIIVHN